MTSRSRAMVLVSALSALMVTAAACAPETAPQSGTAPAFARTSADVVFHRGIEYPINLIFVAAEDDPIWGGLSGVTIADDLAIGPGQFEVIRGDGPAGYALGNISFELDIPESGVEFSSVGLVYEDRTEPLQVAVGSWTLRDAPAEEFLTAETSAEVAAMAACATADLPVPASMASIDRFDTGSGDVEAQETSLHAEASTLTVTLACAGDADFYIISPRLDYTDGDGRSTSGRLSPITIGFQDIDDEDIRRIQDR